MKGKPDLSGEFPFSVPDVKIKSDIDNASHGPHIDVIQSIQCGTECGTEQIRVTETGDVMEGTTNIGKIKMNW